MEEINWNIKPLWKIKLTDRQFDDLKKELNEAFKNNKQLWRFAKESALYYANWWSKEYVGGSHDKTPSKEKIAADLGIKPSQSDDLYSWAKRGLSQLKISPIFRNGRTHYFRTLLLQGGLPLKSLKEGNNKTNYGAFFEGLIKYTNEVNVNYDDVSFIDYLPCKNRLSPSFQTPDFYELNLQIIEDFREKGEQSEYWDLISAVFDRDDEPGNAQRIKKLLTEKRTNTKRLFSIDWNVRIIESEVALFYTFAIPEKIKQDDISETLRNQYEFTVFLNNKEVAKYNRSLPDNNGYIFFVKTKGKNELSEKCVNNKDVIVRLSSNGLYQELSFPIPDFSEPILLTGLENVWNFNKQQQESYKNAVLLFSDSEWSIIETDNHKLVKLYDQEAFWIEAEDTIKLQNKSTNEILELDNTPLLYRYEILQLPKIKSKNRKLINDKVKFRIVYTIDDEIVNKGFDICYRVKQGTWLRYTNSGCLPTGLLYFKFVYPDNKSEYARFFNIGNLLVNYSEQTTNSGVIRIDNWNGLIHPDHGQTGIDRFEKLACNSWIFKRNNESRYYSTDLQFRINDQQGGFADILIVPPFKGIIVTEISGSIIDNKTSVALHSIWRYKCFVFGENEMNVTIFHNKNKQNQRCFIYNLEKNNEIPLLDFEESINNLFTLFGTDHTDYDSFITVRISDDYCIFIRPYNVNIDRDEWDRNNIIKLNTDSICNHLYAIKVDCDYADEIDVFELTKQNNDFVLPVNNSEISGIIVFSDDNISMDKVRPTFLGIVQNTLTMEDRLNNIRNEISNARFIDDVWDKIVIYFRLLIGNNLPLKTIDYFRIVAESPLSMAKLSLILLDHQKDISPDERTKGLLMFEGEFALAWHWIDNATWIQALEWYMGKHDDIAEFYIQDILSNSLLNNSDKIRQLYGFISNKTELNDYVIDEQEYIRRYARYVDIHSDDWLIRNNDKWIIYPKISKIWQCLFTSEYGAAIRTFLWGPAKAALSAMGKDKDDQGNILLWIPENETQRRIIFYYWKLNSEAYTELFMAIVKKINYRLNQINNR